MKPSYTDYLDFTIRNTQEGANPVNVYKRLHDFVETTVTTTEPECVAEGGTWTLATSTPGYCTGNTEINDLSNNIWYDLHVTVYDDSSNEIWNQIVYIGADGESIGSIYDTVASSTEVYLGMIPAYGWMEVSQSYRFADDAGNEYQSDEMEFDIEVKGEQLHGEAWLENKDANWKLELDDAFEGTLTYIVKNPTFDFDFTGTVKTNEDYVLVAGYDGSTNADTVLGVGTSAGGVITISGDVELDRDMKDVKVWLVPTTDWSGTLTPGSIGSANFVNKVNYLWEAGLVWYDDTDL